MDLSIDFDVQCLEMLIRADEIFRHKVASREQPLGEGFTGDCSQLGDWYRKLLINKFGTLYYFVYIGLASGMCCIMANVLL